MNKHLRKVVLALVSLTLTLSMIGLVACKKNNNVTPPTVDIVETEVSVVEHFTKTLTLTHTGSGAVTWTSSDTAVATVQDGVVTALKAGTATVTAKVGEVSDTCAVTVTAFDQSLLIVSVNKSSVEVIKGKTETITASMKYSGQSLEGTFAFASANPEVAEVSSAGVVTAKKAGQATITVKGTVFGIEKSVTVNVNVKSDIKLSIESNEIDLYCEADADKGYANTFTPVISCIDTGSVVANPQYQYTLVDNGEFNDVITIEDGTVTANKSGSAIITATYTNTDGESAYIDILINVHASEKVLAITPVEIEVNSENGWFDYSSISQITDEIVSAKIKDGNALVLNAAQTKVEIGNQHGNKTLLLESRRYSYNVPLSVEFTYLINQENLSTLKWVGDENVVLTGDIDFSEYFSITAETKWETAAVFTGEIDGNGHVIKNIICADSNGLFKQFGGTAKNLSFYNATINGSGVLADTNVENEDVILENVFVRVSSVTAEEAIGALFTTIDSTSDVTISNAVVGMPKSSADNWGFVAGITDATVTLDNCNFFDGNAQTFGEDNGSCNGAPVLFDSLESLYDAMNAEDVDEDVKLGFNNAFVLEISNENRDIITSLTNEYVVLTENLTFEFSVEKNKVKFSNATFTGVFDGKGHSISGLCLRNYDGLFQKFGGVVKNLALTAAVRGSHTGAIASELCGDAKVSDVYIKVSQPEAASNIWHSGIVATVGADYTLNVSNCYVKGDRDPAADQIENVTTYKGFVSTQIDGEVILNNCYFYRWYQVLVPEEKGAISDSSANYAIYSSENELINDIMDNVIDLGVIVEGIINPVEYLSQENLNEFMNATSGTWVLTEDIDMTGITWNKASFAGTLDGRGYAIRNLTSPFLGKATGKAATIKNVAFLNDSSNNTLYSDLNGCTINVENVYFQRVGAFGQFTGAVKEVRGSGTLTFTNCVVESKETGKNVRAALFAGRADGGTLVFNNCYGIIADTSKCSPTVVYHSHSGNIAIRGVENENYFVFDSVESLIAESATNDKIDLTPSIIAKYVTAA